MKIIKVDTHNAVAEFSHDELRRIQGSLREVTQAIETFEFYARVGATKDQIHELCTALKTEMEKNQIDV